MAMLGGSALRGTPAPSGLGSRPDDACLFLGPVGAFHAPDEGIELRKGWSSLVDVAIVAVIWELFPTCQGHHKSPPSAATECVDRVGDGSHVD